MVLMNEAAYPIHSTSAAPLSLFHILPFALSLLLLLYAPHFPHTNMGCLGYGNVILSCCHLRRASTSKRGREKDDIKNKYVDYS